jgi:hypothetical protein
VPRNSKSSWLPLGAAYGLGFNAEQTGFDGPVYRNVNSAFTGGALDASRSAAPPGMRYNGAGEPVLYGSPSFDESVAEMGAYGSATNPSGMANRTMVESRFVANADPVTGTGGVSNVTLAAAEQGMTPALTAPKGNGQPPLGYRLTGENPYSMPQQLGKGATDAGASGMLVPSATGGNQLDVFPGNTSPGTLTPTTITPFDATGVPGASMPAGAAVSPMAATPGASAPGMLDMRPGSAGRSGSARYGAAGGGIVALGSDAYAMSQGEDLTPGQVALDTGIGTAGGAGTAIAFDSLVERGMSARGAGGALGGVVEGGLSTWENANAYANGTLSGSQAAANVTVDTGIGIAAGVAGAELGAAVGSIVPGAGTAVGAGVGFLSGMAGAWLVHALADESGFTESSKESLGEGFEAVSTLVD